VISLLLAIVLAILLIPTPASAVTTEAAELEEIIKNTYRTALRYSGKWSFNGYCGSLVNWQTYLLGIDTSKYGCDGKNEYDLYSNQGTTTGGYRVKCYPASQYNLRTALDAITRNGTVDAYNILVGFQKTNTNLGSIYGHAVFVHGIVDGVVYFVECFSTSLGGQYYAEGQPISCSIEAFCNYYNRWTVFDGVAYFGLKTYADACKEYPASMYALALNDAAVYTEPEDPGIYEGTLSGDSLVAGEMVKVTALLQAPGGGYWYQLDRGGAAEYVRAEKLLRIAESYDDVGLSDLRMPTVIRKGNGFVLRGNVSALNSRIRSVKVTVYTQERGVEDPVMEGQLEVDGKSISLNTWQLDRYMTFRQLEAGTYYIAITAEVETYVLENGTPHIRDNTMTLWNSEFRVVTDWKNYATVTFDGNGGTADICQTVTPKKDTIDSLPKASRPGYVLTGWSLDPEGSRMVTEGYNIHENLTLYAQWEQGGEKLSGWQNVDDDWRYYLDGIAVGGVTSSLESDKNRIENWQKPGGALVAAGTALHESAGAVSQESNTINHRIKATDGK